MEIKTEILEPVIRVGLTESQLTTLRLILLEEKLAAQGHVQLRERGTLLAEVEDILTRVNTDVAEWRAAYAT